MLVSRCLIAIDFVSLQASQNKGSRYCFYTLSRTKRKIKAKRSLFTGVIRGFSKYRHLSYSNGFSHATFGIYKITRAQLTILSRPPFYQHVLKTVYRNRPDCEIKSQHGVFVRRCCKYLVLNFVLDQLHQSQCNFDPTHTKSSGFWDRPPRILQQLLKSL